MLLKTKQQLIDKKLDLVCDLCTNIPSWLRRGKNIYLREINKELESIHKSTNA